MSLYDEYRVERIKASIGKEFVKTHHYSHGISGGPMTWGLVNTLGKLVGVCAFATPISENVRSSIFGIEYKNHVTDLHRLVLLDEIPFNAESFFIARALRGLKEERPKYWAVTAFADTTEGHLGTIYQASNAIYYGTTGRARFWRYPNGRLRHRRLDGVNTTQEDAQKDGLIAEMRDKKHRYLFLTPDNKRHKKWLMNHLLLTPLQYPKKQNNPTDN